MSYKPLPNETPNIDHQIDHDGDNDDDEEVNTTQPSQPVASSTPYTPGAAYHPGEAHEMTNLPREQSGSGDTIPEVPEFAELVEKRTLIQRFKDLIEAKFPNVNWSKIVVGIGRRKGTVGKAVALGPKGGETPIFKQDNTLTQAFQRQYGPYLGPSAEEIIVDDREGLAETNQRIKEAQQQEKSFNATVATQQQALQERQVKEKELEQINQRIANLENEGGTVLERQNETDRLKRQAAKLERDIKVAKDAEKQYARATKERDKAARDVERLQRQCNAQQQKIATKQARLNRTKPLEELNEERESLKRKIEEDRRIMNDENSSSALKQTAAVRDSENTDELAGLDEQIQEREEALPLRERVKNIFKKYGWTLQAVVLAVGLVLGALALAGLKGLKAGTKAVGQGLKAIGQKLGSLLPGLIGSIVSYIFNAAGQVLSFLGEHAWLLILAVVAFFMEKLLKKRRKQ